MTTIATPMKTTTGEPRTTPSTPTASPSAAQVRHAPSAIGMGVSASTLSSTSLRVAPRSSRSRSSTRRWASTGRTRRRTSSGRTKSRPSMRPTPARSDAARLRCAGWRPGACRDGARRAHKSQQVALDVVSDAHLADVADDRGQLLRADDGLQRRRPAPRRRHAGGAASPVPRLVEVAQRDAHEEAVELRLGQRERALELDRVLGREDDERPGSGCVSPSTETWRSCIASSSADWVRGVARLISSTSTTLVKTGPGTKRKSPGARSTLLPVTSPGSRSGVPWTRANDRPSDRANALASSVLPTPGTSSIRPWPPTSSATASSRSGSWAPTTAWATFSLERCPQLHRARRR